MAEQNQNYKVYDFQSVGESIQSYRENRRLGEAVKTPIGIATPMQLATGEGGLFVMHNDMGNQVADNKPPSPVASCIGVAIPII